MLHELERKLTALVGDGLVDRTHLSVVQAPSAVLPLDPGQGAVRVGLAEVRPLVGFERSQVAFGGAADGPTSRRVLPLRFRASLEFLLRPGVGSDAVPDGRALLLEDISLVGHNLAAPAVRDGSAFRTAGPDQGFEVRSFELEQCDVEPTFEANTLRGELVYGGEVAIWPPTPATDEGTISRAETTVQLATGAP
jgi:hypothetical protein